MLHKWLGHLLIVNSLQPLCVAPFVGECRDVKIKCVQRESPDFRGNDNIGSVPPEVLCEVTNLPLGVLDNPSCGS